jgi:hypothetical protein
VHYEKEVDIGNKLRNYLKIRGVINNMFRSQKTLKRRRTKLYHSLAFPTLFTVLKIGKLKQETKEE